MNKILFIDNFDSFTYNLVDEFEKRKCAVLVYRNNTPMEKISKVVDDFKPELIVISPGPGNPKSAGNCIEITNKYAGKIPLFGVCLGHQCIVEAFGGKVERCSEIIHGKSSIIEHDGKTIFSGLQNPLLAARYHSLVGLKIPADLEVSAKTANGIVMAVRHKQHFVEGVQFHPESIMTATGGLIIENILKRLKK